jgi:hypothetical protein
MEKNDDTGTHFFKSMDDDAMMSTDTRHFECLRPYLRNPNGLALASSSIESGARATDLLTFVQA